MDKIKKDLENLKNVISNILGWVENADGKGFDTCSLPDSTWVRSATNEATSFMKILKNKGGSCGDVAKLKSKKENSGKICQAMLDEPSFDDLFSEDSSDEVGGEAAAAVTVTVSNAVSSSSPSGKRKQDQQPVSNANQDSGDDSDATLDGNVSDGGTDYTKSSKAVIVGSLEHEPSFEEEVRYIHVY